ncbi:MAG TPA: glycosyltransferase, partial [Pyrinomonadaceae bacterium]|nr:glycosyltransferase [Pyrinomonadaceae bacterium]
IVECAAKLADHPDIRFIFLGTGVKRPWLEKQVKEQHLTNITVLDPMPRSEQIDFLNACDVAVVTLVNRMKGVSMPSRTYNALAAGKPILGIVEEGSELAQVVSDDHVGWIVPPHKPDLLHDAMLEIYQHRHDLAEMAKRARSAALHRYSLELALERYRAALR